MKHNPWEISNSYIFRHSVSILRESSKTKYDTPVSKHVGFWCISWIISQMKHQLDATLFRFYFCRVTLHVSGASAHHQEYLKLVQRLLEHVLSLQVSHHISLLGQELNAYASLKAFSSGPNKEMWWLTCNDVSKVLYLFPKCIIDKNHTYKPQQYAHPR